MTTTSTLLAGTVERHVWFTFQISDDDRMSLTTAVSDEEDGESVHNSPYKGTGGSSATAVSAVAAGDGSTAAAAAAAAAKAGSAASFNCTGAVRKAGFLSVKKWLLRKKHQVMRQELLRQGKSRLGEKLKILEFGFVHLRFVTSW